ncbi:hypothetical protein FRC03_001751, partial [Tulasnella sp. 419]
AIQYAPQQSSDYPFQSSQFGYGAYPNQQQSLLRSDFLTTAQPEVDLERTPMAPQDVDTPQTTCWESPTSSDGDHVFDRDEAPIFEDNERWDARDEIQNTASLVLPNSGFSNNPSHSIAISSPVQPQSIPAASISSPAYAQVNRFATPIITAPSIVPSPTWPATPQQAVSNSSTPKASAFPREMHLVPPPTPISPYYRPSAFSTPVSPSSMQFPPPADLNPRYMRQSRLPPPAQACVSPKNLILPSAQFKHASDPRGHSPWPSEQSLSESSDFDFSLFPTHTTSSLELVEPSQFLEQLFGQHSPVAADVRAPVEVEEQFPFSATADPLPTLPIAVPSRKRSRTPEQAYEQLRPKIEDDVVVAAAAATTFVNDSSPDAAAALDPPVPKRARLVSNERPSRQHRATRSMELPSAPPKKLAHPSLPQPSSSRARKLVPGLQRHFACMHGCESRFSTAYEARRHQEDQHARPEAQGIIDEVSNLSEGVAPRIYPRDKRFILQIGLSGGAKWSDRIKRDMKNAIEDEDSPMSDELSLALVDFSKEWVKRYNCPVCGLAFSRLDSRKRHMEKQCNA